MCGIAGFWDPRGSAGKLESELRVARMAGSLAHRGPDDQGAWAEQGVGLALGHSRLAILDLSRQGRQPMESADSRYVLVFNGEIYNFRELRADLSAAGHIFRGSSDTEVLLAGAGEWGLRTALRRCVGMFALALWDRQERTLHLARDRAGEKPLFYGWNQGVFMFASELKALRSYPDWQGGIDRRSVSMLIRYGYIPAPLCIYEHCHKLVPGTVLTMREPEVHGRQVPSPEPYWSLEAVAEAGVERPFDGTEAEATDALHDLLSRAVSQQMISDVPLGAFLSGGVDSSLVVALMQARSKRPVRTFSIGFSDRDFDEAPRARAVARFLGTQHQELYVGPAELNQVIPQLPSVYDEPLADHSQLPTILLCRHARQDVKVALSGDGGDELFCGYEHYRRAPALWRMVRHIPAGLRRSAAGGLRRCSQAVSVLSSARLPWQRMLQRTSNLADVLEVSTDRQLHQVQMSPNREASSWLKNDQEPPSRLSDSGCWQALPDLPERMMWLDFASYLPDDILVKVDRAAMAVGLETRAPLLDHRVVEFAWALPRAFKQRGRENKWLLRRLLYGLVPRELVDRPKKGFAAPLAGWLRGPLREWCEDLLQETTLNRDGFFEAATLRRRWAEHASARRDWSAGLWHVLVFQSWLQSQQHKTVAPTRPAVRALGPQFAGAICPS